MKSTVRKRLQYLHRIQGKDKIFRKVEAEAELAALEDLRLSRAMGYISISPSTVGGCLTLEEVRAKQQQDLQIKRRQKQVKTVF
ncbi:uncharacterized protein isoform X1 [Danio rerio]|uniref:Uncharacterized protein isoform X1 n=1 Tax=Danio rerio TaxID=7955 RepID=A0AC58IR02_DANRE